PERWWPVRTTFGGGVGSTWVANATCVVARTTALSARDEADLRPTFCNAGCAPSGISALDGTVSAPAVDVSRVPGGACRRGGCGGVPGESPLLPSTGNSGVVSVDGPASGSVASRLGDRSALPFTSDDRPFRNLLMRPVGRTRRSADFAPVLVVHNSSACSAPAVARPRRRQGRSHPRNRVPAVWSGRLQSLSALGGTQAARLRGRLRGETTMLRAVAAFPRAARLHPCKPSAAHWRSRSSLRGRQDWDRRKSPPERRSN